MKRDILLYCLDDAGLQALLTELIAKARKFRDLVITIDGLIIIDTHFRDLFKSVGCVMLMDDEVRDSDFEMESSNDADRRITSMGLDRYAVCVSKVTDLPALSNTAAVRDIRLNDR